MLSLFRYIFAFENKVQHGTLWKHESDYKNPFSKVTYRVAEVKNNFVKYEVLDRNQEVICEDD